MNTAALSAADSMSAQSTSPPKGESLPSTMRIDLDLSGSGDDDASLTIISLSSTSPNSMEGAALASEAEESGRQIPFHAEAPLERVSYEKMPTLQWIDPLTVCKSDMPNRAEQAFQDEAFEALSKSMLKSRGNTQAIQVRALSPEELAQHSEAQFMLIAGERRLRAAIENRQPVFAIVLSVHKGPEIDIRAMTENLARQDLSPLEFGRQLHFFQTKHPGYSLRELKLIVGRDPAQISRALDLAALPGEVVDAFTSVRDIGYADAKPLKDALDHARENVLTEAALIKDQAEGLKGKEVLKRLVEAAIDAVAPCNTPAPIDIRFEERVIGRMISGKKGESQIVIDIEMADKQRVALVKAVEQFISKRVLRSAQNQSGDGMAKGRRKDTSIKSAIPSSLGAVEQIATRENA